MAVFSTPFTTAGNYTYDNTKIEISGGLATLKENLINVYGRWHMNESLGSNVPDDSGNGRDGTAINTPTWVAGKLSNSLNFNGSNQYVDCGDIASFEYTDLFSAEAWIRTSAVTDVIMGRALRSGTYKGWLLWLDSSGYLEGYLFSNVPGGNWIQVRGSTAGLHDSIWHHVVMTYAGTGTAAGIVLYVDGALETMTVVKDTLTSTIINASNFNIGGVDNGSDVSILWNGRIDETVLYNKILLLLEVEHRYNFSNGREDFIRFSDKPTIYKTAGDSGTIYEFNNFAVVDGVTEGSKGYQLSEDGITWYYWSGSAWVVAGALDYNLAAIVNININSFSTASDAIYVKTFFISDGFQREEIDEIQITYLPNANPLVDAGTNKEVFDNLFLSPFSDATFSDPDGTVDFARYKIDGEVDVWTNIPKGGYGTLLEAVQALSYQFVNSGDLTARLQVEDNIGATSEDTLTVTVKKYTKIVNVRDIVTNEHILNFDFNPGDSSGTAQQDSPFEWSWDYGSFDLTVEKAFFYLKQQGIMVTNEDELIIYMQASAFLNQCVASIGLLTEDDRLSVTAWLQQGGEVIETATFCSIVLYDQNDTIKYTDSISTQTDGHFTFNRAPSELENEGVYHLDVQITAGGVDFISTISVGLIERKLISFEGAVHINVEDGEIGTTFPKGTPLHPVKNWADAKVIADTNNLIEISILGDLVIGALESIAGYTLVGASPLISSIQVNGGSTLNTTIKRLTISGAMNGAAHINDDSEINGVSNFEGEIHSSGFVLPDPGICLALAGSGSVIIINCWSEVSGAGTPIIDMGGSGRGLSLRAYSGGIKLINKTGSESVTLEYIAGQYKLASTVINGYITIRGVVKKGQDDSGPGCIVDTTAAVINPWAALISENLDSGTFGELMNLLRAEAVGRMDIDFSANTLTLYELDNMTVLKVFDLSSTIQTLPSYIGRTPR